jgi:hypothetical protein
MVFFRKFSANEHSLVQGIGQGRKGGNGHPAMGRQHTPVVSYPEVRYSVHPNNAGIVHQSSIDMSSNLRALRTSCLGDQSGAPGANMLSHSSMNSTLRLLR